MKSLLEMDIVKSKYLKKALCLPMSTNNDVVYNLSGTKRLVEELNVEQKKVDNLLLAVLKLKYFIESSWYCVSKH